MRLPEHLEHRLAALERQHIKVGTDIFEIIETDQGHAKSATVLLLHGIGSTASSWLYQLADLANEFRVIAWNAPGYGATTPLALPEPTAADYATALKTLCDALALDRIHLVGQSLGALIATAFTKRFAQQVMTLTLLNPARGHGQSDPEVRANLLQQRLDGMAKLGPAGNAERRAGNQLSANPSADALALVRWNLALLNPTGYSQAAHMLANANLADDAEFSGPVQVLSGGADSIVPSAKAQEVAACFADCQFHTLPGLGHAAYVEGPELVNQHLREFFSS